MKIWHSPLQIFKYAFDDVVSAVWNRYPNDYSTHIFSEDILECRVEGNKIFVKKLIIKKGTGFLKKIPFQKNPFKSYEIIPCIEESIYDRDSKTLKTYTRNVSHNDKFMMEERCVYSPCVDKYQTSTDLKRLVLIHVNFVKLSNVIQKILLMSYKRRLKDTDSGLIQVLSEKTNMASERILNTVLVQKSNARKYINY
uniref:Protein preli-like (inferred by orthology to a D. melanogaster protein) n=1 Tax=Strongyloides venezuelensis TaxID=75913 RepID=A0A0K0F8M2_STRVS